MEIDLNIKYRAAFSINEQTQESRQYMDRVLNFAQNVVKKVLYEHKFKQIGRLPRFFLSTDMVPIKKYDLEMWPGYTTSVKALHDGIFLNVDCATKFIDSRSILDLIIDLQKDRYSKQDIHEHFVPKSQDEKRLVVITKYNSRIYQIDDIKFDMSPKTHVFTWNYFDPITKTLSQQKTDMARYMNMKYGISIHQRDLDQPLLVVHELDQNIYLIPSLCNQASLSKSFTSDSRKMKDLQDYKLSNPEQRYNRINTLIERFQHSEVLDGWGLKIEPNFAQVRAKQLPDANIVDKQKGTLNWSNYENRGVLHAQPIELKKETWALVYANRDYDSANNLVEMMTKASRGFGIRVEQPQYVEIQRNDNKQQYIDAITADIDPGYTQLVVVVLGNKVLKPQIKALLDKMGVPSQFILSDTLFKKGKALGVFSNLLKQMNAKLKRDLYNMSLPNLRKTMIVGTDIVNTGGKSLLGLCASMTQEISQYYTKMAVHDLPSRESSTKERLSKDQKETIVTEKRCEIVCIFIREALQNYQAKNKGPLPDQIVIYRDGIGGPTLQEKLKNYEIQRVLEVIQSFQQGYNPMVIYCFVDRNVSHRLFYKANGDVMNPSPGTVLDSALVENQGDQTYDFFMIPHKATVATAQPVHFKVVYNTSSMNKEQFEMSTYHLCYNYVNFTGPIKVPSPCMYAKKIADYSAENKVQPNSKLAFNLHFL
uniref:Otiwi8 n=1 Tax=Oxytricha trifallax TaxID=94289 RepID=H2DHA1_OXYTR|nr:Otiwi8 [Sterkiella histriomuscorum]